MSTQWAVVFFANDFDQTMSDAAGPFRSRARAHEALIAIDGALHAGATPQVVQLHPLREVVAISAVPEPGDSE